MNIGDNIIAAVVAEALSAPAPAIVVTKRRKVGQGMPDNPDNYMDPAYGPEYRALDTGVESYRRKARRYGSVAEMPRKERQAYGQAVHNAIRRAQQQELYSCLAMPRLPNPERAPADIGERRLARLRGELSRCPSRIAGMKAHEVQALYDEAMEAKRNRPPASPPAPAPRTKRPWIEKTEEERAPLRAAVIANRQPLHVDPPKRVNVIPTTLDDILNVNGVHARIVAPASRKGFVIIQPFPSADGTKPLAATIAQRQLKGKWSDKDSGYLVLAEHVTRFRSIAASL